MTEESIIKLFFQGYYEFEDFKPIPNDPIKIAGYNHAKLAHNQLTLSLNETIQKFST